MNAPLELKIEPEAPPLERWDDGSIRVVGTRVKLEIIVNPYRHGESPEEIAYSYPTVTLKNVYGVIAYYLNHKEDVDRYLREQEERGIAIRKEIEARNPPDPGLKAKLLARMAELEAKKNAASGNG